MEHEASDPFNPVFKTGQRVPVDGYYVDQYGFKSFHAAHKTFPPCIGRKGECAVRQLIEAV